MSSSISKILRLPLDVIAPREANTVVTLWCSALVFLAWVLSRWLQWPGAEETSGVICAICGFSVIRARVDQSASQKPQAPPPEGNTAVPSTGSPEAASPEAPPSGLPLAAVVWLFAAALFGGFGLIGCTHAPDLAWDSFNIAANVHPDAAGDLSTDGVVSARFTAWDNPLELRAQWTEHSVGACLAIQFLPAVCGKWDRDTGFGFGAAAQSAPHQEGDKMGARKRFYKALLRELKRQDARAVFRSRSGDHIRAQLADLRERLDTLEASDRTTRYAAVASLLQHVLRAWLELKRPVPWIDPADAEAATGESVGVTPLDGSEELPDDVRQTLTGALLRSGYVVIDDVPRFTAELTEAIRYFAAANIPADAFRVRPIEAGTLEFEDLGGGFKLTAYSTTIAFDPTGKLAGMPRTDAAPHAAERAHEDDVAEDPTSGG